MKKKIALKAGVIEEDEIEEYEKDKPLTKVYIIKKARKIGCTRKFESWMNNSSIVGIRSDTPSINMLVFDDMQKGIWSFENNNIIETTIVTMLKIDETYVPPDTVIAADANVADVAAADPVPAADTDTAADTPAADAADAADADAADAADADAADAADKKIVYYEFYPNPFKGWLGGKTSKRKKGKRKSKRKTKRKKNKRNTRRVQ